MDTRYCCGMTDERFSIITEPDDIDPAKTVFVLIDRDGAEGSAFGFETEPEAVAKRDELLGAEIKRTHLTDPEAGTNACGESAFDEPETEDIAKVTCMECLTAFADRDEVIHYYDFEQCATACGVEDPDIGTYIDPLDDQTAINKVTCEDCRKRLFTGWADMVRLAILADVRDGVVPRTVGSFSELHSFVDANEYVLAILRDQFDGSDESLRVANTIDDEVDEWIKGGGLEGESDEARDHVDDAHWPTDDHTFTLCGFDLVTIPQWIGEGSILIADDPENLTCPICHSVQKRVDTGQVVAPYVESAMKLVDDEIAEGEYTAEQATSASAIDEVRDISASLHESVNVPWSEVDTELMNAFYNEFDRRLRARKV
jgi:hypothetical protein